ncbi:MAG: O-antigen ligase family protein [bacterium]
MSDKTYLKILRWGIYLTLLTPLLVFKTLLFPFITSKAFYFRIIIEILFVIYILFILQYRNYMPKKKAIAIALIIFTAVLVFTSFTGVDFNLSFWGDIERMEGVFGFAHLLVYFFIIISVFRTKEEWRRLFFSFGCLSFALCLYGLGQKLAVKGLLLTNEGRISSTLGNPAYLGGIALFGMAAGLMFFSKSNKLSLKLTCAALVFFNFFMLILTGTRGAYLGLVAAIIFAGILYIILIKNKKLRIAFAAILAVFFISGIILIKNANSDIIKKNLYLYRITHISFNDATWNTRLISWKAGWEGFKERPFFGVGTGNYAYYFDKYFPPVFYTYTAQQTYFDHAHNTIVDIAVTSGLFGILSYLAIWAIVIYYLINNYKTEKIDLNEFIILSALLAAYFVQNIFVFDCLATFMAFFIFIAYIAHYQYDNDKNPPDKKIEKLNIPLTAGLAACSLFLIFKFNIMPARAMAEAVDGQYKIMNSGDMNLWYEAYKKALSHNTVLDRDIRGSLINALIGNRLDFSKVQDRKKLTEIIDFVIDESSKNLKLNPYDAMMNLQMGQLYNLRYQISNENFDLTQGEFFLKEAFKASPGRLQVHFILAQNKLIAKDFTKAIEILENAKNMNPAYGESYYNLSLAYLFNNNIDKGFEEMYKSMTLSYNVPQQQLYKMAKYFNDKKEYEKLSDVYLRLIYQEPKDASLKAKLAAIYGQLGKIEDAKKTVAQAVELDPNLRDEAEKFLRMLEAGSWNAGK